MAIHFMKVVNHFSGVSEQRQSASASASAFVFCFLVHGKQGCYSSVFALGGLKAILCLPVVLTEPHKLKAIENSNEQL